MYLCNVLMKNHCIPYFGGKEITDSLKTLNTIGQATTYVYNYPVSKKLRQLEKLVAVGAFDEDVETLRAVL